MLLEECHEHFNTKDLYEVLHAEKSSSAAEIKKAYYKQSMKFHPDKAEDNEEKKKEATVRFQIISKVYGILSDKEKRAVYDETGAIDEENALSDEEAVNVWRKLFKKVTLEDLEKFCEEYKGSEEERLDVRNAYEKNGGDMTKIMNEVLVASSEDEERIKDIIKELIKEGKLKETKKFKSSTSKAKTATRQKKAAKEAKEAEQYLKEIQAKEGFDDLQTAIMKRSAARSSTMDNFYDSLAEKYAPKKKSKK
ncbi:unnamed protein product [Caenorhabditis auriculariae]|uniref:J domain-containing protein n=1 Tax=Caenorhabditis auriculariae TaxID=2777116 RepID=A0A8S1H4L6_9PELO|nr:unnamed protein product [Caenorhabditis auriculariae]